MTKAQAEETLRDEIALLRQSLSAPSTGNAEQDEALIFDAARSTAMIAAGFCPNGCGEMAPVSFGHACPACGFSCNS